MADPADRFSAIQEEVERLTNLPHNKLTIEVAEARQQQEQQQLAAELRIGRALNAARTLPASASRDVIREQGLSKIRAYELMAQAEFVDRLVASGQLDEEAVTQIQPKALKELSQSSDAVVRQICEPANEGQFITAKLVKALAAEDRATSTLLPRAVRMGVAAGWIPAKKAAALACLLVQLPSNWSQTITQPLEGRASADQVTEATAIARALVKVEREWCTVPQLQGIDLDAAVTQAMAIDAARLLTDAITAASQASEAARKLNAAHQRLAKALNPLRAECPQGSAMGQVVIQLEAGE